MILLLVVSIFLIILIGFFFASFIKNRSKDLSTLEEDSELEGNLAILDPNSAGTPIAYYNFDGNAQDYSGNSFDGSLMGDPTFVTGVSGKGIDKGIQLDGDDCVYLENSAGESLLKIYNKDLTISAWVKLEEFSGWRAIVSRASPHYITYWMALRNKEFAMGSYNAPIHSEVITNKELTLNKWHHVSAVFDREENIGIVYLDGEKINEEPMTIDPSSRDSGQTKIGCRNTPDDYGFKGTIDEVKIWNYALSTSEIKNEFSSIIPIEYPKTYQKSSPTPTYSGCDPDAIECAKECNNIFTQNIEDWSYEFTFGVCKKHPQGSCTNDCEFYEIQGRYLSIQGIYLPGGEGDQAWYKKVITTPNKFYNYFCPSFELNGNNSVIESDCTCLASHEDLCAEADYASIFDFSDKFFTGKL